MREAPRPEPHVIVVFGANGDLARRKLLPALFHLYQEGLLPDRFAIVGTSRSPLTDAEFRDFAYGAVDEFCKCAAHGDEWARFAGRLTYVPAEFSAATAGALADAVAKAEAEVGGEARRLFYLAVPPSAFGTITEGLGSSGLTQRARVVYEKPFGSDRASFGELSRIVSRVLDETQVYRIDHFLGKESVQNILALRFANGMFEPVWNRDHIDHVQIDVPEELGIGTRAAFYEGTGALKDMLVTHLLQVLSVVAMEPPASLAPKALIDERVKVFDAMVPLKADDVVRGQFAGYRALEGVDPRSDTETFVAARVQVDNWRWAGVPFFLRTGKRLAQSRQTITLAFRSPPRSIFDGAPAAGARNHLTIELGSHESVSLHFLAKAPGPFVELAPARMDFSYGSTFGSKLVEAYERLLHDALIGDRTLFTRPDGIERTWDLVAEPLAAPPPVVAYDPGSWGPEAMHDLISPRRWFLPDATEAALRAVPEPGADAA
ncbi:MAG TPA: glucose-6-phosphate dehydrogenase [Actinomycetota bacterium]|nr:glucose-6-phosphate dehydrogenase [Actinomycetota bacterium]